MKTVPVEESVGMVLCQDITKIVPGEFKGRAFKKGHVIRKEDVEELLKLGKENIYVWESGPDEVHENEAALRIARATAGSNVEYSEPYEGKSTFHASIKGLFKVNSSLLYQINAIDQISVACMPNNFPVEKGRKLVGARVIPLVVAEEKLSQVEELCREQGQVFEVKPYRKLKVGIVTTGSEVFKGRIKDKFGPVIREKVKNFEGEVLGQVFCPDDIDKITGAVRDFKAQNADLIVLTGGMSVDPDDLTPGAIKQTGARVVTYGVPIQPGNMFMMAYLENTALIGIPGCGMFFKTTVMDVVLPRIFAGEEITRDDFIRMGEGGFCSGCDECHYPVCYFCRN